jgi:Txe/YoeB family toxin of Txe-Axe toxin-antitoxin module
VNISFAPAAFADFRYWIRADRKIAERILDLLEEIKKNLLKG